MSKSLKIEVRCTLTEKLEIQRLAALEYEGNVSAFLLALAKNYRFRNVPIKVKFDKHGNIVDYGNATLV